MGNEVAALDCGTTTIKAGVFSTRGRVRATARREAPLDVGPGGRVEQDADALVSASAEAMREAIRKSGAAPADIGALAISTQRATVGCVGADGRVLGPLLSWQDNRGAAPMAALRDAFAPGEFHARTGLPPSAVFTVGKLVWLRASEPDRYRATARFCLVHDLLLGALGADGAFVDASNASLTGLFDARERRWSARILDALDLDAGHLPTVVEPGTQVGRVSAAAAARFGLAPGTPLVAGGGDQQCAGLGMGALRPGIVGITLGTSAVPLTTTSGPVLDPAGGLMTCAHAMPGTWELEGFQNSAGSALAWVQDVLGLGRLPVAELDRRLEAVPAGSRGVVFLPFLTGGASAPHWDPDATGTFLGLVAGRTADDLLRAVVEGVAFETRRILDAFRDLGAPVEEIRACGGLTRVPGICRVLADAAGVTVRALRDPDASLAGAAVLAATGAGAFASVAEAAAEMAGPTHPYEPDPDRTAACDRARRGASEALGALARSGAYRTLRRRDREAE